jgi:hypothetical protein
VKRGKEVGAKKEGTRKNMYLRPIHDLDPFPKTTSQ